ncbi:hypothetical protein MBLNU13_g08331t2 [Cladosporium sp. NU13]
MTNPSPVSLWIAGPESRDSDHSSMGGTPSDGEETRAPLKRSTLPRNLYTKRQTQSDPTPYGNGQQQGNEKKPESKTKSRYDNDTWGTWDSNAQSQPVHHRGYGQEHPQQEPGVPSNEYPFAPSVLSPYTSDSRYLSPNYDYRPYVVDRLNPLVRNPPTYAQPWTQPISTVSMPYSLLGPRLDAGVKDFSSYSYAHPPLPPGPNNWRGQGISGGSHSLPDRLDSNHSDDPDDDHQGAVLPNVLHAGRSEAGSSQTTKKRKTPVNWRIESSLTKESLAPEHSARLSPTPVSATLGAEAVPLPPSRSHSPLEFDPTLEHRVLPPLPPLPASGKSSPDGFSMIQAPSSHKFPYTTEHNKSMLEHAHTADGAAPDKDKSPVDDIFAGSTLPDLIEFEKVAKAKAMKKTKKKESKGKAVKSDPVVVEVPPPSMPPPPNLANQPFFQHGQEPTIVEVDEPHAKKPKKKAPQYSGFARWMAGQPARSPRHTSGSTSSYAQRISGSHSSYAKRVNSLIPCMPHLESLYSFARKPETSPVITRLDYKNNIENPRRKSRRVFRCSEWLDHDSKGFAKKLSAGGTSSAFLRVLFIEDLTEALIDSLGTLYGVDPELFASHMSSSGSSTLSYDDTPPARWSTAKMRKSYYSLKWYRPVRLEERVSHWLRSKEDLAKLEGDGLQWSETAFERRGQDVHEIKTHHNVTLDNNVFRRSWPLSSDPDGAPGGGLHAAWEEKASVFITSKGGLRTMLMDTQTIEETVYANRLSLPLAKGRKAVRETTSKIAAFHTIAPRAPTDFPANNLDASDGEIQSLSASLKDTHSTSADIESWIWRLQGLNKSSRNGTTDPLVAVLRLACIDSTDYLDHLSWTLDEITRHSLDESIMIKRLPAWRKLLSDLEIELPTLGQDLHAFIEPTHAAFSEVAHMLADIDNRIGEVLGRVRNVYAVLRSEMALLDSSRSIAEARTVAKLTELAFAFIPLTFACSIFSMQVTELQNGVPFWAFVVTAVAMGLITYAVRLVLQSNALSKLRRDAAIKMMASGAFGSSAGDQDVTTVMLFRHLVGRIWQHRQPVVTAVVFLTALAIPVIPIAFLWSRNHMDVGFNTMLTVLTLPAGIVLAWYAQSAIREAAEDKKGIDDDSSVARLSTSEWLAMRVAPLLGRSRRRDSIADSTSDEEA